jgi:hypothetical protein
VPSGKNRWTGDTRVWPGKRTQCLVAALALALALQAGPRAKGLVAADWTDSRAAGPFICHADFSLVGLDPHWDGLVQLRTALVQCLVIPPPTEPIELYLLHDEQTYARYLKKCLPGLPYRRALYVKKLGPGMVFIYCSPQFEVDLRHECTHALLHAALQELPLWLDEGLAKYFEVPPPQQLFDNPQLAEVQRNVHLGRVPKLEELESKTNLSQLGRSEYRDAWAWVHFLLWGPPEAHEELVAYLADLRTTPPPQSLAPLSARLKQRFADPAAQLAIHFRTWKR